MDEYQEWREGLTAKEFKELWECVPVPVEEAIQDIKRLWAESDKRGFPAVMSGGRPLSGFTLSQIREQIRRL